MTAPAPGHFTSICSKLWKEQRDQIAQIHSGAASGDRRSQALLAQIEIYNAKLHELEELGKFVSEKEGANADRS